LQNVQRILPTCREGINIQPNCIYTQNKSQCNGMG